MSERPFAVDGSGSDGERWYSPSLARKAKQAKMNPVTPRKNDTQTESLPSTNFASPSTEREVRQSPAPLQASRSYPVVTEKRAPSAPLTPSRQTPTIARSQSSVIPGGTPSSRKGTIDRFFKDSTREKSVPLTPSRPLLDTQPKSARRVIVIDDSEEEEEEEVPTDIELTESPTRISSSFEPASQLTADSSQSSMNSLFSQMSMSSSMSSVASPVKISKPRTPHQKAPPAVVNDIFGTGLSPNVTHRRKTPKADSQPQPYLPSAAGDHEVPESVLKFSRSPFGTELEEFIIVHCNETQQALDDHRIAWGTQYELARGVSSGAWSWDDVRARIHQFKGTNAEKAYQVQSIMRGRGLARIPDVNLWKELDREQLAIHENRSRGLGLMGDWEGISNWYGGQIQQIVRMIKTDTGGYNIVLEPMEKRRSHRFARYYGSRRFLQLRIPDDLLRKENTEVKIFLTKKFILCGRVFLPFHSKDGSLYMVETDESYGRQAQDWCGDQFRMSFCAFINWHNPLDQKKNYEQVVGKYATRFALGLSNSVPALEFEEGDIIFIDDLTSSKWPQGKPDPPAVMLMTDGCGFMNHAGLRMIVKSLGYENVPAGVQGRIDGSKGFWILHPTDRSTTPKIWIRTSQNKIKNRSFDRAHRIFDLLGPSRPSPPTALSQQSIMNLFANNVPQAILVDMMQEGLEKDVAPLLEWNGQRSMVFLANAVNKAGNVSGTRTLRVAAALNRALGLQGRDWDNETVEMEVENSDLQDNEGSSTVYSGRNEYSGAPLSMYEMAVELIQAGFHPATNKQLYDKIGYIVQATISSSVQKYRIPIEESLGAYIVPDPLGVLKEGEIYYRFSNPRRDPKTDMLLYVLEGEVVLGRYPIRLPSDMQKVKAVDRRELDKWPDVVIISTQGKRSIASLLADGDMDGDELIVIWDPVIVENFDSKTFTNPPDHFMEDNFEKDVKKVEKFCQETLRKSQKEASEAFQEVLIANLSESNVGLYSMMHENSVVRYGYGHPYSVRLAYIFATLVDASKTGRRLKTELRMQDLKEFGNRSTRIVAADSPASLDILDILKKAGEKKGIELLQRFERAVFNHDFKDKELSQPYDIATDYALSASSLGVKSFHKEMSLIRKHVDEAHRLYLDACALYRRKKETQSPSKPKAGRSQKKVGQEDVMLACARAYAQPIPGIVLIRNLEQVKAGYAFKLSEPFAYSVAFQELCHIKAMVGGIAPTRRIFDEAKTFSSSFLRALNRCEDENIA